MAIINNSRKKIPFSFSKAYYRTLSLITTKTMVVCSRYLFILNFSVPLIFLLSKNIGKYFTKEESLYNDYCGFAIASLPFLRPFYMRYYPFALAYFGYIFYTDNMKNGKKLF